MPVIALVPLKPCSWTPAASSSIPTGGACRDALAKHGVHVAPEALKAADPHARRELDDRKVIGGTTDASRGWLFFDLILAHAGVTRSEATAAALAELHTYHTASNLWEYVPDDVLPALDGAARARPAAGRRVERERHAARAPGSRSA